MAKGSRKLVPISSEILERIWTLSERVGKPGRVVLEEILDDGLKVYEKGYRLDEAVELLLVSLELKRIGFTLVPRKLFYNLLSKLSSEDFESLRGEMRKLGEWYGKVISIKYNGDFDKVKGMLKNMFWDATEVTVKSGSSNVEVTIISPEMPKRMLDLTTDFIESLMKTLGFKLKGSIVDLGIIDLKFER